MTASPGSADVQAVIADMRRVVGNIDGRATTTAAERLMRHTIEDWALRLAALVSPSPSPQGVIEAAKALVDKL